MRSLFWKIFLWFWLAMTLVIAATALVSTTVRNASENRPQPDGSPPRWRVVANASFAQWAQTQAQTWENSALQNDDLEMWLLDQNESVLNGSSPQELEWWLFSNTGKLLAHQDAVTRSTSPTLNSDLREIVRRAAQSKRVVSSPPGALTSPPPEASEPDTQNLNETLLASRTQTPRGQNVIFVARLSAPPGSTLANGPRSHGEPPPNATARRVFPLAGWFLRGDPLMRTTRFLTMLLTAGLFCWWLARHVTRPITQLRTTVDQLSSGNLAARSDPRIVRRADELGELGRDFNTMAARLETLVGAQKRLVADVSHELRSPLARLNVALELARRQVQTQNSPREAASTTRTQHVTAPTFDSAAVFDRIEREATRLETIVSQLLTISRPDGEAPLTTERIELAPLLKGIADDVRFEYSTTIEIACEEIVISAARDLLRGALENIVRNAARFSPPGKTVRVSAEQIPTDAPSKDVSMLRLQVRDEGSGVPEESLPRLFEPFYRVEDARDRKSGGVGLGLAIAQQAVHLHNGTIRAENAPGGGLIVTIELPPAML